MVMFQSDGFLSRVKPLPSWDPSSQSLDHLELWNEKHKHSGTLDGQSLSITHQQVDSSVAEVTCLLEASFFSFSLIVTGCDDQILKLSQELCFVSVFPA